MRSLIALCALRFAAPQLATNIDDVLYPANSLEMGEGNLYPLGGVLPSPRIHHSMALVEDLIVVYGGYDKDGSLMNDINIYDTNIKQWSGPILKNECCNIVGEVINTIGKDEDIDERGVQFTKLGFAGDAPLARAEHGVAVVSSKMYLFGGVTEYGQTNDLYSLDTKALQWRDLAAKEVSTQIPARRSGHSMNMLDGEEKFVLFGGAGVTGGSGSSLVGLNDVWTYDVNDLSWQRLDSSATQVYGRNIPGRQHSASAVVGKLLYVYGGVDPASNYTYSDLWVFHLGLLRWETLSGPAGMAGFAPPPLYKASLFAIDNSAAESTLVLYGGIGSGGRCGDDTATCPSLQTALGQVYTFSVRKGQWASQHLLSSTEMVETEYVTASSWSFARKTSEEGRGRLKKYYALEGVVYAGSRGVLYEFGGLEAIDKELVLARQQNSLGVGLSRSAPLMEGSSGKLDEPLADRGTQEHLTKFVQTPANGAWVFRDGFERSQPSINSTYVNYIRSFRSYVLTKDSDIVLVSSDHRAS